MLEPIILANWREYDKRCNEVWLEMSGGEPFDKSTPWTQEEAELAMAVINAVREEWGLPMYENVTVVVI